MITLAINEMTRVLLTHHFNELRYAYVLSLLIVDYSLKVN